MIELVEKEAVGHTPAASSKEQGTTQLKNVM